MILLFTIYLIGIGVSFLLSLHIFILDWIKYKKVIQDIHIFLLFIILSWIGVIFYISFWIDQWIRAIKAKKKQKIRKQNNIKIV